MQNCASVWVVCTSKCLAVQLEVFRSSKDGGDKLTCEGNGAKRDRVSGLPPLICAKLDQTNCFGGFALFVFPLPAPCQPHLCSICLSVFELAGRTTLQLRNRKGDGNPVT